MTFQDYVTSKRSTKKIPTDILARWQERIVATGLDKQGAAGARSYLALYGKNSIAAPKCINLARCAESEDCPEMAVGFWAKVEDLRANWGKDKEWHPNMDADHRAAQYANWKKAVTRTFDWVS